MADDVVNGANLDDSAEIHDPDPIAHGGDHTQVMGDEQIGEADLGLKSGQQVEDVGLDRHVEGGHHLVAQEQLRIDRHGPGDVDPLSLASRQFVRAPVGDRGWQPHRVESNLCDLSGATASQPAGARRRLDALPHGHAGVEGVVGVLEDHLHPASLSPEPAVAEVVEAGGSQADLSRDGCPLPAEELRDGPSNGRLPGSGLADQSQGLPGGDVEAHPGDGVDHLAAPGTGAETDVQISDRQHRRRAGLRCGIASHKLGSLPACGTLNYSCPGRSRTLVSPLAKASPPATAPPWPTGVGTSPAPVSLRVATKHES